jgi:hypothetical protein
MIEGVILTYTLTLSELAIASRLPFSHPNCIFDQKLKAQ